MRKARRGEIENTMRIANGANFYVRAILKRKRYFGFSKAVYRQEFILRNSRNCSLIIRSEFIFW